MPPDRACSAPAPGGVCAYHAAKRPDIDRLVLLNTQLDYKQRTINSRFYRHDDQLDEDMATRLREDGFIQFTPSLRHGRPILNEVFWFRPLDVLGEISAPTLPVHGTKYTFVPVELSRAALPHDSNGNAGRRRRSQPGQHPLDCVHP